MYQESSLPEYLSTEQQAQVEDVLKSEIVLISCVFWRQDRRRPVDWRSLGDSYLFIPTEGELDCGIGSNDRVIAPGEFMMVGEGIQHRAYMAEGTEWSEAYAIHVHAFTAQGAPLLSIFDPPYGNFSTRDPWTEQLALLTHLMGYNQELGQQFGEAWLRQVLLHQILQGTSIPEAPKAMDDRVWQALDQIMRHYAEPVTITDLADWAGISEVHFRNIFRRGTGMTPKAYIQQFRLRKARALLRTKPRLTIKEVAAQTGFSDSHYFHAAFKKAYGITPAQSRTELLRYRSEQDRLSDEEDSAT